MPKSKENIEHEGENPQSRKLFEEQYGNLKKLKKEELMELFASAKKNEIELEIENRRLTEENEKLAKTASLTEATTLQIDIPGNNVTILNEGRLFKKYKTLAAVASYEHLLDATNIKDVEKITKSREQLIASGGEYKKKYRFDIKGTTIHVQEKGTLEEDKIIAVITDRTEIEEKNEKLSIAEDKAKVVSEVILDYVYCDSIAKDGTEKNEWITGAVKKVTGYTIKQMKSFEEGFLSIIHEDDIDYVRSIYPRLLNNESMTLEYRIHTPNGEFKWIRDFVTPIYDENKKRVVRLIGAVQDITSYKLVEDELRLERDKAQKYLDIAGVVILLINNKHKVELINRKGCDVLELPCTHEDACDCIIGKDWVKNFIPDTFKKDVRDVFKNVFEGNIEPVEYHENPVLTATKKERLIAWHNAAIRDEKGKVISLLSSGEDITLRKKAEEALRENEEKYRYLIENTMQGVLITKGFDVLYANSAVEHIWGYSIEEVYSLTAADVHSKVHPADREYLAKRVNIRKQGKKISTRYNFRGIRKDGEIIWLEVDTKDITYKGEKAQLTTFIDVTEKKRAEDIQDSLYRISEAVSTSSNLDELFAVIHNIVKGLINANNLYIALYDSKTDMVTFPYFVDEFDEQPGPQKPGRGLTEYVLRTNKPLLAPPAVYHRLEKEGEVELLGEPCVDWVGVPLRASNGLKGVIAVQSYDESTRYVEEDKNILTFVSEQIARAIEYMSAREELQKNQYLLTRAQNIAKLGSWEWNLATNELHFSKQEYEVLSYDENSDSLTFDAIMDSVYHEDRDKVMNAIRDAIAKKAPFDVEFRIKLDDGSFRYLHGLAEVIYDDTDTAIKMLGTTQDVTDRKRTERELTESKTLLEEKAKQFEELNKQLAKSEVELKELNASKDKFFSIISHDLRSPFVSLLGFSEYMAKYTDELDPEETKDYLTRIYKSAKNIFTLIDNLLQWSRLQTGGIPFSPAEFNLKPVVDQVINLLNETAVTKFITLTNKVAAPIEVYADQNMIETVIRNLISNAIKFTEEKGEVVVDAKIQDDDVLIMVSDNGVGMDSETIKGLFKIDVQYTTSGTRQETGTGLGLVLCKEFIEKNNGTIWAESISGSGSKFRFLLPQKTSER